MNNLELYLPCIDKVQASKIKNVDFTEKISELSKEIEALNSYYQIIQEKRYSEQVNFDSRKRQLICREEEMHFLEKKTAQLYATIEELRIHVEPAFSICRSQVVSITLVPHSISEFKNILKMCKRYSHASILYLCRALSLVLELCVPSPILEDDVYLALVTDACSLAMFERIANLDPAKVNAESFDAFEKYCMHHSAFKRDAMEKV